MKAVYAFTLEAKFWELNRVCVLQNEILNWTTVTTLRKQNTKKYLYEVIKGMLQSG